MSLANNYIEDLPIDFRCPKFASLALEGNRYLTELPSEFLHNLTSFRVFNLLVKQLKLLEFLSLRSLCFSDLPEEICYLSKLQFLDFSQCSFLESLLLNNGELKNLKHLGLLGVDR